MDRVLLMAWSSGVRQFESRGEFVVIGTSGRGRGWRQCIINHPACYSSALRDCWLVGRREMGRTVGGAFTDALLIDGGKRLSTRVNPNRTRDGSWRNGCLLGRVVPF